MLSGIGPADHLRAHGIGIVQDLPGVGKNLQDHVQGRFTFLTRAPGTLNEILTSTRQQARMALEWLRSGAWQQWDRKRLQRNGGTMEQYKHPCLIADAQFHERMREEAVVS